MHPDPPVPYPRRARWIAASTVMAVLLAGTRVRPPGGRGGLAVRRGRPDQPGRRHPPERRGRRPQAGRADDADGGHQPPLRPGRWDPCPVPWGQDPRQAPRGPLRPFDGLHGWELLNNPGTGASTPVAAKVAAFITSHNSRW